jgi:Mg2+-importing ATPase
MTGGASTAREGGLPPAPPRASRRAVRLGIALLVLVALVYTLRRIDWREAARAFERADPTDLAAAALLVVLPLGLRSLRAHMLASRCGLAVPPGRMAAITIFGFSLSSLTPGGSGDLLRVAALRPHGVSAPVSVALVVYERGLDLAVVVLSLVAALLATLAPSPWVVPGLAALAFIPAGAAVVWIVWAPSVDALARVLPAGLRRLLPPSAVAAQLLAPATLARAFGLTLAVFAFEALRPWLVTRALGFDMGLLEAWSVFTLAWLAGLLSLLPLGVGSWETAAVWAFGLYGVPASPAAAGAVLLRVGVTLPALAAGALSFAALRRSLASSSPSEPA